jgi:hypothetical protein
VEHDRDCARRIKLLHLICWRNTSSQKGAIKVFDTQVKYPEVHVRLVGEDGNAFAIMGRVSRALKEAGVPQAEIDAYYAESTSGDYDNLLRTATRWVQVA